MIVVMNEKGVSKHIEDIAIDKDYMVIDTTSGGSEMLYRIKGVKTIGELQFPDVIQEEDCSEEKKDRAFEKFIESKQFVEGIMSLMALQTEAKLENNEDKNFILVLNDNTFDEYHEEFCKQIEKVMGIENEEDAPYMIIYKPFKKKSDKKKDIENKEYHEEYFMHWISHDIKGKTAKRMERALEYMYEKKEKGSKKSEGKTYKERKEGKKHHGDDLSVISVKKKKDKDKKDKDKKDKKKKKKHKKDDLSLDIKDIKKGLKKVSKGITLR